MEHKVSFAMRMFHYRPVKRIKRSTAKLAMRDGYGLAHIQSSLIRARLIIRRIAGLAVGHTK